MRLPRPMRLSRRSDFHRVRTQGRAFPGRYIVLSVLSSDTCVPSATGVPFRFGLILTRKTGKAVVRNRIRRHLRAILSEQGETIKPGTTMVIIGRFRAPDSTLETLRRDWQKLAEKAGILRTPSTIGTTQATP